jgi:hypothetical protein
MEPGNGMESPFTLRPIWACDHGRAGMPARRLPVATRESQKCNPPLLKNTE